MSAAGGAVGSRGSRARAPPPASSGRRRPAAPVPSLIPLMQVSVPPAHLAAPPLFPAAAVPAQPPLPASAVQPTPPLPVYRRMGSRVSSGASSEGSVVPPSPARPVALALPSAAAAAAAASPDLFLEPDSVPAPAAVPAPVLPASQPPLHPPAPAPVFSVPNVPPPPPPMPAAGSCRDCAAGVFHPSGPALSHGRDSLPHAAARRRSRRPSRTSRSSRHSHRSRSARWNSPSSSDGSPSSSGSSDRDRRRRRRRGRGRAQPTESLPPPPLPSPGAVLAPMIASAVPSTGSGESPYAGVWGAGVGSSLVPALRALADQLAAPASQVAPPSPSPPVSAGLMKDVFYCGVSPLGAHLDADTRQKIWDNGYVDIWSLVSADQHTIDKERKVGDRPFDRKPKVARTVSNWLQAFSVLGCVMGQKHPERCSELFIYQDIIYSSFKAHGGNAWLRYDEEFRRRLALNPGMGWGVKATDVWLRLMLSPRQPSFLPGATASSSSPGQGAVAVRRPGTCWMFNEGHCRFFALCKFRHECSVCGGAHAAVKCSRPSAKLPGKPSGSGEQKDPGERGRDGPLVRPLS